MCFLCFFIYSGIYMVYSVAALSHTLPFSHSPMGTMSITSSNRKLKEFWGGHVCSDLMGEFESFIILTKPLNKKSMVG